MIPVAAPVVIVVEVIVTVFPVIVTMFGSTNDPPLKLQLIPCIATVVPLPTNEMELFLILPQTPAPGLIAVNAAVVPVPPVIELLSIVIPR